MTETQLFPLTGQFILHDGQNKQYVCVYDLHAALSFPFVKRDAYLVGKQE